MQRMRRTLDESEKNEYNTCVCDHSLYNHLMGYRELTEEFVIEDCAHDTCLCVKFAMKCVGSLNRWEKQ